MKNSNILIKSDKENVTNAKIELKGDLTLRNVVATKNTLVTAIDKFSVLDVQVKNVENLDLSFLQLLFSLKKTCKTRNKQIHFSIDLPDDLNELVSNAGFNLAEDLNNENS